MVKLTTHLSAVFALLVLSLGTTGCTKELRAKRHLSRGDTAFKAEKYDEAEIEYLKVRQLAPLEPEAVRRLAIIYQDEGKLVHAREFLVKALQADPQNPELRLTAAMNELLLGDARKAVEDARMVLAKQPGQAEALELLSGSAPTTNGLRDLQQEIEKLRKADQDRASYHVAFGTLDLRRRDSTNAETEFKKAVELDPKSSSGYLGLGGIYWSRKDLAAADRAFKSAAENARPRQTARLKYAEFQYATGKTNEAKQYLQQITKQTPDYLPAWTYLAQLAFTEKNYDECNSLIQRVLARDSYNFETLMLNGTLRLNQGDPTNAVANFTRMAGIFTRSPQVLLQLARASWMINDVAKATLSVNKAVALDPDYADAVYLSARLSMRKGDSAQAIAVLNAFIKRQPQAGEAYLLLVDAYLAKRDSAQALTVGRQMADLFPNSAQVQLVLGSLLEGEHQMADARKAFEKAVALAPNYLPAIEKLVELDLSEKQYPAATQRVQALIDKYPTAAEPWLMMANIETTQAQALLADEAKKAGAASGKKLTWADVPAAQTQINQAEAALLKAIDLQPGSRSAYLNLAKLYISSGKQQQALDRLNGLLSKTNDAAALTMVGMLQDSLKNYPAARDAYEKVLSANPNSGLALNNLAYLYSERLGDPEKGLRMAERAHQLQPYDGPTSDTYGWALYKKGDYARALSALEESSSKLPDDPEIQFHLGMTHYMLGEEGAARLALQHATQSARDFPGKDIAALKLAVLAINPKNADAAAVSELQKVLQDTPQDPIALDRLGAIQERDGALDKAVETYQTALKHDPQDAALSLKLAQLYASPRLNDPQKAIALAKAAHDQAPDNPRISALLGQLVYKTGDCKWAASLLEDSQRKLPEDAQVAFDLAQAYYGEGRVSDAKSLMQKVVNTGNAPANVEEAKRFLTTVAATETPSQAAAFAADAQKILASNPGYVPALMVTAMALEGQGKDQDAAQAYAQIVAKYPLFSPATRNLGLLYFDRLKDDQKAYDLTLKAREAFPQDAAVAKALGVLTYRKGSYSRAAQLLKESSQSRKNDAELLYYLGMAEYQLKAKPESKAALQQALKSDLAPKLAEDAKRVLTELK